MKRIIPDDLVRWIRASDLPQRAIAHQLKRRYGIDVDPSLVSQIRRKVRYRSVPD